MIPLIFTKDATARHSDKGMRWPSQVDFLALVAATGATLTVPTGAKHVLMKGTSNFFVSYTITALTSDVYGTDTVSNGVCAGDGAELVSHYESALRTLDAVTGMSVIASAATSVTFSWFG